MKPTQKCLLIAGALHLDELATTCAEPVMHASNPVRWGYSVGGVAANAARSALMADRANHRVALTAAVGTDPIADILIDSLQSIGLHVHTQAVENAATGRYSAIVNPQGHLLLGLADVDLARQLAGDFVTQLMTRLTPEAILVDANLSEHCLIMISERCTKLQLHLTAMAVSPVKARKLLPVASAIHLLFCNRREAMALTNAQGKSHLLSLSELADKLCAVGFYQFVLTDEDKDVIVQSPERRTVLPIPDVAVAASVNGAGDALAGASFAAYIRGAPLDEAVREFGLPQAVKVISGEQQPVSIKPGWDVTHG